MMREAGEVPREFHRLAVGVQTLGRKCKVEKDLYFLGDSSDTFQVNNRVNDIML